MCEAGTPHARASLHIYFLFDRWHMKMSNSMLIGQKGVKYGLQVRQPKKPSQTPAKKPSIFEDDDSDEDQPNVEQQIARQASRKQTDKKV